MKKVALLLLASVMVISCAPQSRFAWGSYENSLYKYYKNPENREAYRSSMEKAVQKGVETNRVAPGMLAELGFLALEDGDVKVAVAYFEREMVLFPESKPFLSSVVKRAAGDQGSDENQNLVS